MQGLSRHYGSVAALDNLDLTVQPGELIALLGPSGCGKTTTLRLLAGLEDADTGTIFVGGKDITRLSASKRDMGMVFQAYSLFPHMTVKQNVGFGLRLRGVGTAERDRRALEMLELVELTSQADRYPSQISGGQQQRVALARALAIEPQVLLLDEPLSALDAKVRAQLRDQIRRIQLEIGITTLFVTHDQEEALAIADRVGVMRAGRIEQLAPPTDVYSRPATAFVAEFVGLSNRLAGTVTGSTVTVRGRDLPLVDSSTRWPGHGDRAAGGRHAGVGQFWRRWPADRNCHRFDVPRRHQPGDRRPGRHHDHGSAVHVGGDQVAGRKPSDADDPAGPGARVGGRGTSERRIAPRRRGLSDARSRIGAPRRRSRFRLAARLRRRSGPSPTWSARPGRRSR